MKDRRMLVFVVIALAVYGLVNLYIGRRGAQALASVPGARTVFLVIFVGLALLFPLGRIIMAVAKGKLTSVLVIVGTFHLGVMLYGFMAVLAVDLVRLANAFVPFLPRGLSAAGARTGPAVFGAVAGAVAVTLAAGAWNATRLRTVDLVLRIPGRSAQVEKLTVVAASDLHLGTLVGPGRLAKVVRRINALEPDVVLFAGDIVDETVTEEIEAKLGGIMGRLRAPLGLYACPGNHEFYSGLERNLACLASCGITVLEDEAVEVGGAFILVGRRDPSSLEPQEKRLSIEGVLNASGPASDLPVIVLDHQPIALEEAERAGAALQISGHTHDGQVFPIGLINGLIYEHNYGYLRQGGTHVYVTSGAGTWGPPVRIGSRAEIVRIELCFDRAP
ncbi:MAG: metallophosphoesterase [Candidatus Aminicenantes bacterium]|nr:metallophosphoesterase [Candidatus Aminicenantes bacterium]